VRLVFRENANSNIFPLEHYISEIFNPRAITNSFRIKNIPNLSISIIVCVGASHDFFEKKTKK